MYQQYFSQAKSDIVYLSTDELKELLNDDEKLEVRINNVLNILEQEKNKVLSQNRGMAECNMNKEPEIIERKSRISELTEQGKSLCSIIQDQLNELKLKRGDKTPDTVLALLQAATAECEENSEVIASKFQDSEISIDEYLEKFQMARKIMHSRKLKTERMAELVQTQGREGLGMKIPPYPQSSFYPSQSTGTPYPSRTMPMPNNTFAPF